jgi:hypothetical protein
LALTRGDAERVALAAAAGAMPALAAALQLVGVRADAASAAAFSALLSVYIACDGGEFTKDAGVIQRTSDALHALLEPRIIFAATRAALREADAAASAGGNRYDTRKCAWREVATLCLRVFIANADVQLHLAHVMRHSALRDAVVSSGLPPAAILDVMRAHPAHLEVLAGAVWLLYLRLKHDARGTSSDEEDLQPNHAVQDAVADGAVQLVLRACAVLPSERVFDCVHPLVMLSHAGAEAHDVILQACMDALRSNDGQHRTATENAMYNVMLEIAMHGSNEAAAAAASLGAADVFVRRTRPNAYSMQRVCVALQKMTNASDAARDAVLASCALAVCRAQLEDVCSRPISTDAQDETYKLREQLRVTISLMANGWA